MKRKNDQRKVRKLFLRIKYLREDLEEHEEEKEEGRKDLVTSIEQLKKSLDLDGAPKEAVKDKAHDLQKFERSDSDEESDSGDAPSSSPIDEDAESGVDKPVEAISAPDWIKKIYRKIVLQTHPDKLNNMNLSADEKRMRRQMYMRASSALRLSQYAEVIEVAVDLEIDLDEIPTDEKIRALRKYEGRLINDINKIKQEVGWIWYHANDQHKKIILNNYKNQMGWSNLTPKKPQSKHRPPARKPGQRPTDGVRKERLKK